jgi:hypothetical protein
MLYGISLLRHFLWGILEPLIAAVALRFQLWQRRFLDEFFKKLVLLVHVIALYLLAVAVRYGPALASKIRHLVTHSSVFKRWHDENDKRTFLQYGASCIKFSHSV